ncbi:unnamed protein product, partial [Mesorhabditis belari]|uniref:NEDD8-activating enzyme E1 catalytic subunit n=1 Tax=Mesorhabditis belari TaxID=2138241 RepID=A0AAF3EUQ5_9BILA
MSTSVENKSKRERFHAIRRLCENASEFATQYFSPGPENLQFIREARILVIGAGGLGCELLKDLALSGFGQLDVIDMDTIDLSNLNRQFLFRESDIGHSKAEVAAAFVSRRVSTCKVMAHHCAIEEKSPAFYKQFHVIVCGLDSIKARRWINSMLCDLVEMSEDGEIDSSTIIPFVDGGTEGFKGNVRVIYPKMTACVECLLDLYPPQVNYPMCTIAHTPRLPEHCVEYVKAIEWPKEKPFDGESLDADRAEHVDWVLERAKSRAEIFGIKGVDHRLCLGVLKRIIPAVASTNAVVAASCALEVLKLVSNMAMPLDNYLNFSQTDGVHCAVVQLDRNHKCLACGENKAVMHIEPTATFETLMERLKEKFHLTSPDIRVGTRPLYVISDLMPELKETSEGNLIRPVSELIDGGVELLLTDPSLNRALTVQINFAE